MNEGKGEAAAVSNSGEWSGGERKKKKHRTENIVRKAALSVLLPFGH